MKEYGIIRRSGDVFCEKCNSDVSKEGSVECCSHWGSNKQYGWNYKCVACGNSIELVFDREPDDFFYEEGDEDENS